MQQLSGGVSEGNVYSLRVQRCFYFEGLCDLHCKRSGALVGDANANATIHQH